MSVVEQLIVKDENTLSFGNYKLDTKTKLKDFEFKGDLYKIKTFYEITKLEKNGLFVYESVPGTAVHNFDAAGDRVSFEVEGKSDAQITLELEESTEYDVTIGDQDAGVMRTNLGGKLILSVELEEDKPLKVVIVKK